MGCGASAGGDPVEEPADEVLAHSSTPVVDGLPNPEVEHQTYIDGKRVCKYGEKCYNKTPGHLEEFAHPWLEEEAETLASESDPDIHHVSEELTFEEARSSLEKLLATAGEPWLLEDCETLAAEVQEMDIQDRMETGATQWQFSGRKGPNSYYNFDEEATTAAETAYQAWVEGGKSKKPADRRFELEVNVGHGNTNRISLDFLLMTQLNLDRHAIRNLRRQILPSKAATHCKPYFSKVLSTIGDICEGTERVTGHTFDDDQQEELEQLETDIFQTMESALKGSVELAQLCHNADFIGKLEQALGSDRAAQMGLGALQRDANLDDIVAQVTSALAAARGFRQKAGYDDECLKPWAAMRFLVSARFWDISFLDMRQRLVLRRQQQLARRMRFAFMQIGSMLAKSSDDEDFQQRIKDRIRPLIEKGLRAAMEGSGDLQAIKTLLEHAKQADLGDLDVDVQAWLERRFQSAVRFSQPIELLVDLLHKVKDGLDVHLATLLESLQTELVEQIGKGIVNDSVPPALVNQVAYIRSTRGDDASFDEALFAALEPLYHEGESRPKIAGWLVAYCEHVGVDPPPYCMNEDQAEASAKLEEAIASENVDELKAAVIAAKLVPDLKEHDHLKAQFEAALEMLRASANMPPGWDLEDMLAKDKMFLVQDIEDPDQLALFQDLVSNTFQKRWTRDRKTRGDGGKIADRLQVSRVTEVQNGSSWPHYADRREEILSACSMKGSEPTAPLTQEQWKQWSGLMMTEEVGDKIAAACDLIPLDKNANEFLLFHGSKPEVADIIAENHFNISYASKDGMFGAGLYFAEASSKSDEYCVANDDDERPLILVRVLLGKIRYVDQKRPYDDPGRRDLEKQCIHGTYHSVLGDRIKTSGTYRELVVYDHYQCYPHFIVWYKRVFD